MHRLLGVLVALIASLNIVPANAMQFSILQASNGQTLVLAQGEIGPGDARKLMRLMETLDDHDDAPVSNVFGPATDPVE